MTVECFSQAFEERPKTKSGGRSAQTLRRAIRRQRGREDAYGVAEIVLLEDVRDADLVQPEAGGGVEARRGRDHDRLAALLEARQEPSGEILAVLDRKARHEVERALGLPEEDAGNLAQAAEQDVAALLVLGDDTHGVVLSELRRARRDELSEARRREAALRHAVGGAGDVGVSCRQRAQPDAARAIPFREAVHDDDQVLSLIHISEPTRLGMI